MDKSISNIGILPNKAIKNSIIPFGLEGYTVFSGTVRLESWSSKVGNLGL